MTNQSEHRLNQKCLALFTATPRTVIRRKKLTWLQKKQTKKTTQHLGNKINTSILFAHSKSNCIFLKTSMKKKRENDMAEWINPEDESEYFRNDKKRTQRADGRGSSGGRVCIVSKDEPKGKSSCDVLGCDAGHAQRLHNPDFSWHTAPPILHLSPHLSHSLSLSVHLCWARRGGAGTDGQQDSTRRHRCCARRGGAGRGGSKGKSDRGSGSQWEHEAENG